MNVSMQRGLRWLLRLLPLVLAGAIAACGTGNKEAAFSADSGHPAGWSAPDVHGAWAKSRPDGFFSCQSCHGDDFAGGITKIACFTCHGVQAPHARAPWRGAGRTHTNTDPGNASVCAQCHTNGANSTVRPSVPAPAGTAPGCFNNTLCHATPGHPAGWSDPTQHGPAAKATPGAATGFANCETCHGADFLGGAALTSCFTCHGVSAPHAPAPWRMPTSAYTHTNTDQGNAPVCAQCHTNGANSTVAPNPPAPAGTAPGCFNNTLCHAAVGHPAGWSAPTQHGAAAKSTPAAAAGFAYCESCHGTNFSGGTSLTSCFTCHGVSAPHAPAPWRMPTSAYTHTNTDPGNATVCAQCHTNGANSTVTPNPPAPAGTAPGCFNNTLCHAAVGHPAGWSDPTQHGAAAKSTPAAAAGFAYCESCHGTNFSGGTSLTSCFTCHGVSAPHAPAPWRMPTSAYTHTNTDQANAPVCAQCHTNGANSSVAPNPLAPAGTPPGCFNSTLCHATPTCGSCHGIPPDGTAFPNTAGSHSVHVAVNTAVVCGTCHQGAGSGTALHQNGVADVLFDATYNAKSGAAAYNAGTLTCTNIACHGSSRTQTSTQGNANPPQSTPGPTPVWTSGTINVNTQCTLCHVLGPSAGLPENNSYYSGQHRRHVYGQGRACTDCHDTTKLAPVHFTSLTAPISETTAATTLKSTLNFNGTTCSPGCHGTETW